MQWHKVIGDQLCKDPTLLVPDLFATMENVVRYKAVYPGVYLNKINITLQ